MMVFVAEAEILRGFSARLPLMLYVSWARELFIKTRLFTMGFESQWYVDAKHLPRNSIHFPIATSPRLRRMMKKRPSFAVCLSREM
jgi:hypothetical protein